MVHGIVLNKIGQAVMSSLEIAELTGKLHKNIMADIRNMFTELQIDSAEFSDQYKDSAGRSLPMFNLPYDLSLLILTSYSTNFTIELIKFYMNNHKNLNIHELYINTLRPEFVFGEDILRKLFNGYTIIPQFKILDYRIDFYIPELKIAIEFDENHHRFNTEKDELRQKEIEKALGCTFLRYKD